MTQKGGRALVAAQLGPQKAMGGAELSTCCPFLVKHSREVQGVRCAPGWSARSGRSRSEAGSWGSSCVWAGSSLAGLLQPPAPATPGSAWTLRPDLCAEEQGKNTPAQVFWTRRFALGWARDFL